MQYFAKKINRFGVIRIEALSSAEAPSVGKAKNTKNEK